jgi:hypothetical protein
MLTMLFFLLPGLPGGPNGSAARMNYVASAPRLWRLGWFPWQFTALSDLLISLALLRRGNAGLLRAAGSRLFLSALVRTPDAAGNHAGYPP